MAASLAISAGVVLLFIGYLFVAIGQIKGTPGKDRLLLFLSPADLAVGAALILAVALVVLHRQRPVGDRSAVPDASATLVNRAGMVAGMVAAVVVLAAIIRGIVGLTVSHQSGGVKFGNLVDALAAALVAASAAVWALRTSR